MEYEEKLKNSTDQQLIYERAVLLKQYNTIKKQLADKINNHWQNFKPFDYNTKEYQEGLKLIKGLKTYKNVNECITDTEYENQIIEKGAYSDSENAIRLFDLLKKQG